MVFQSFIFIGGKGKMYKLAIFDLDVTILFDRLYSQYNNQIVIKNIASSMDEFHYSIKLNDQVIIIKNKEELQKMVKKAYGFESGRNHGTD